jgi:hypothetical protein
MRLLHNPRLPLIVALLAALLALPALFTGYQIDDYMQVATIRGIEPLPEQRSPWTELFSFMDGDPERNAMLRDRGVLPWHIPLDLKARLLRPVTAGTHILDDAIARDLPVVAHLHSIAWGALLVALVAVLIRRVEAAPGGAGAGVAGLAALIYAVDEARGWPIAWIANRNALITGVLGVVVLLLYDRWRRDGWRPGAFLAPSLFALALFAGEAAIATTAYLFGYALFLDDGPLRQRLARLMPYAVIVVGWRALWSVLGYGTANSALYLDPVTQPLAWLAGLTWRLPALGADQFLSFPSMLSTFVPMSVLLALAGVLAVGLALLTALALPTLRRSPRAAFWATGMGLSLLPICATFPWNRLLTFAAIGGAGLIAHFVSGALGWGREAGSEEPEPPRAGRLVRLAAWGLVVLHLGLAPLALAATAYMPAVVGAVNFSSCSEAAPKGAEVTGQTFIYVNANDLCSAYVAYIRAVDGEPVPRRVFMFTSALYDLELATIDARTVEMHIPAGMNSNPADTLLRDEPMAVGAVVELPDVTVEVLSHNESGHVDRIRATFAVPIDDDSLVWIRSRPPLGEVFEPPAPGASMEILALGR